ncbi:pentapeptide repeat-containing protein [Deltaproteobacteria bacterium TL4]
MKRIHLNWQIYFFIATLLISLGLNEYSRMALKGDCDNPEPHGTLTLDHCDFRGRDFSGKDFRDVDFSNLDFTNANFENAVLLNVSFKHSRLNGANFKKSYIYFTDFDDSCLLKADFSGAQFHRLNFWKGANLKDSIFTDTVFEGKAHTLQSESYRLNCEQ